MSCNSDYLNATSYEIEMSRVACLLDELKGKKWDASSWDGYHKNVYNKDDIDGDKMVRALCAALQSVDVTKYSLEMQIWWRDHQKADKERIEKEILEARTKEDKAKALKKLTPYERKLLGY